MFELCCGDVADITGGQLQLGVLPPIGGRHEPVLRIGTRSDEVQPGDVFWDLTGDPNIIGGSAEEAFIRGAAGVVTARRGLEPWAGSFAVVVRDARRALLDLGNWARRRTLGRFVLVSGDEPSLVAHLVSKALAGRMAHTVEPAAPLRSASQAALELLRTAGATEWNVYALAPESNSEVSEISHLCCPHVAVITSAHDENNRQRKLAADTDGLLSVIAGLPDNGLVILHDIGDEVAEQVRQTSQAAVLTVGRNPACDWPIQTFQRGSDELRLVVRGERTCLAARADWSVEKMAVAYATARILGASRADLVAACDYWYEKSEVHGRNADRNMEVPPLVSGLRESETTLPPGLKRHAC